MTRAEDEVTPAPQTPVAEGGTKRSRRPALVATSIALPITVLAAFAFTAGRGHGTDSDNGGSVTAPLSVAAIAADPAAAPACTKIFAKLPIELGTLAPRRVRSTSTYIVAWGAPPVILRCGVPRPASLKPGDSANEIAIGGVEWDPVKGKGQTTWTSIDRSVYMSVTVPDTYPGDATMTPIATALAATEPAVCTIVPTAAAAQQCVNRR